MKNFYQTFYSFSAERTNISSQLSTRCKTRKNINILKKHISPLLSPVQNKKYRNNDNLENFHINSLRTEVYENIRYKLLLNNTKKESFHLPNFTHLSNKVIYRKNTEKNQNNKLSFFKPEDSLITLSNFMKINPKTKNKFPNALLLQNQKKKIIHKRKLTYDLVKKIKPKTKEKSYRRKIRAESISEFYDKTKKNVYSKYINYLQKKEIIKFNEGTITKIELFNVEIAHLENMLMLLNSYINDENQYLIYLQKTLKKEKEICLDLIEKKNESLHETFLLRNKLGKIQRTFEKNFNNKFFLLCVKNGTNQIDQFLEEDKIDYLNDKDILEQLSDFSIVKRKVNEEISKNENLTNDELEILVFGRKIFNNPKPIFSSPESFKIKLGLIESKIQMSLDKYNETQNELDDIRNEYMEKIDLIQEDKKIDEFYKKELILNINHLNELKIKNKYLNNYITNIPQQNKDNEIKKVEEKILEIYSQINEKVHFKRSNYLIEKYTSISYLKDIEWLLNKLFKFKHEQMKNNYEAYFSIQKKIDKQHRIDTIKELKEKAKHDLEEKINKVLIKSSKLIIKANRKIEYRQNLFNKKIIKNQNDDYDNIALTYE